MAMNQQARSLPPFAQWTLTRRIPCAFLAMVMYGSVLAFAGTFLSLPLLVLHILTPTLFTLIALGGGTVFAMQVALLTSVGMALLLQGALGPGLILLILYAALPIFAAGMLATNNGASRSGLFLAISLLVVMLAVLLAVPATQGSTPMALVHQLLAPLFQATRQEGIDPVMLQRVEKASEWIFPGVTTASLWVVWWGDVMLARTIAVFYGFYRGDMQPMSAFRLPRMLAYGFVPLVAVAGFSSGTLQYLAVNAALLFVTLLSVQGLAVVHTWLQAKRLQMAAIVMYALLLIQPVMVLPFALIGLLDIWFDYRRNIMPANGGK
jgi:Predicted membrane protein (DUF2232)